MFYSSLTVKRYDITLKALSKFVADDALKYMYYFSEKIRLEILCESSARQKQIIHMKWQVLFYLNTKNNYFKMSSAVVAIGAIRLISLFRMRSISLFGVYLLAVYDISLGYVGYLDAINHFTDRLKVKKRH